MTETCHRCDLLLHALARQVEAHSIVLAVVVEGDGATGLRLLALERHSRVLRRHTLSQASLRHERVALSCACLILIIVTFFEAVLCRGIHRCQLNLEKLLEQMAVIDEWNPRQALKLLNQLLFYALVVLLRQHVA